MLGTIPKYQIILADPPWAYNDKSANRGGAAKYYKTLSLDNLKKMNVSEVADSKASILLMWATMPLLPEALELMAAWGFKYKTTAFCWAKRSKRFWSNARKHIKRDSKLGQVLDEAYLKDVFQDGFNIGMGAYTRANVELVLLGVKGKGATLIKSHSVKQVIDSEKLEHSRKPDELFKRINELVGCDVNRLELFSRKKRTGWHCLGDEVSESNYFLNEEFQIKKAIIESAA